MLTSTVTATAPASPASTYVAAPPGLAVMGNERMYQPQPSNITGQDMLRSLNPLQHLPGVGMIYRAVTGDTIPAPLAILGSIAVGAAPAGPIGIIGTILSSFAQELMRLGPAVPGHTLLATDYPATSDGPVPQNSVTAPGITYADGTTGSVTWEAGKLTNFDLTLSGSANGADSGSDGSSHDAAIAAYNRAVSAFGGLGNVQ